MFCFVAGLGFAQAPDTLWSKLYGGNDDDFGLAVSQTIDGGFIIAGGIDSMPGNFQMWLLKTNGLGDTLWTRICIDSLGAYYGYAYDVQQTHDGGYILYGGFPQTGSWFIKTDSLGNAVWMEWSPVGPGGDIHPRSIKQTLGSGYIMTGMGGYSIGGVVEENAYLSKTDSLGSNEWSMSLADYSYGHEVQLTNDGGYIVAAGCVNGGAYFAKVDLSGAICWEKIYGSGAHAWSICRTNDGGYAVLAIKGNGLLWLLRTDSMGDTIWTKSYTCGGLNTWQHSKMSVRQTPGGGFVIGGTATDDMHILKTDLLGNVIWESSYGGLNDEEMGSVELTSDRGYIVVGSTTSFGSGGYDIYLFRLAPDTLGINEQETHVASKTQLRRTIVSGALKLPEGKKCKIFDITGRVVEPTKIAPGIYFLEVDNKMVQKVVKVR